MLKRCLNIFPYLVAIITSIVLTHITCKNIPAEYASIVELSDEHEVSLMLDLGSNSLFRNLSQTKDYEQEDNMRDPVIYSKILESQDFIDTLASSYIPTRKMSYGEYLKRHHHKPTIIELFDNQRDEEWVKDAIHEQFIFQSMSDFGVLKIQIRDTNPVVAKEVTDNIVSILSRQLNHYIKDVYRKRYEAENALLQKLYDEYEKKRILYVKVADADFDVETTSRIAEIENYKKEAEQAFTYYQEAYEKVKRSEYILRQPEKVFTTLSPSFASCKKCAPTPWGYFIAYLIITLSIVVLTKVALKRKVSIKNLDLGDIAAPWNISVAIWIAVLLGIYAVGDMLYPIGEKFWIALLCWLPILLITSYLTYTLTTSKREVVPPSANSFEIHKSIFIFFLCVSCLMTPLHFYKMWQQIAMLDPVHMMSNIRALAVEGDRGVYGFLNYASWINKSLFLVTLWYAHKMPKGQILLVIILNLISSVASMEKSTIFMMVVMTMFVLFVKKVVSLRTIVSVMICMVGLLFLINVALESSRNEDSEYELFEFIGSYILTPPVAFSYLHLEFEDSFGLHTFPSIYKILNSIGFNFQIKEMVGEFVFIPMETNVYTIMKRFYCDFGYKGIAFFAFIYGIISGWAYSLYRKGSGFGKCLYTFVLYCLVMQYYMENLIVGLYLNIFFLGIVYFITQQKLKLKL